MSSFKFPVQKELTDSSEKSNLITWQEGERIIDDWFINWWSEFEKYILPFQVNWRGWQGKRTAYRIFLKLWALAHVELFHNLYSQNKKRRGMQQVTTRNWQYKEIRGGVEFGQFSGKPAWKRRRGRPPLSESAWIERRKQIIQKKRQANKTEIVHKDRKPIPEKAPPTVMPRPTRGESFGRVEFPKSIEPEFVEDTRKVEIEPNHKAELFNKIKEAATGSFDYDKLGEFLEHLGDMLEVAHVKSKRSRVDEALDNIYGTRGED